MGKGLYARTENDENELVWSDANAAVRCLRTDLADLPHACDIYLVAVRRPFHLDTLYVRLGSPWHKHGLARRLAVGLSQPKLQARIEHTRWQSHVQPMLRLRGQGYWGRDKEAG
jgi:hypothetical protein